MVCLYYCYEEWIVFMWAWSYRHGLRDNCCIQEMIRHEIIVNLSDIYKWHDSLCHPQKFIRLNFLHTHTYTYTPTYTGRFSDSTATTDWSYTSSWWSSIDSFLQVCWKVQEVLSALCSAELHKGSCGTKSIYTVSALITVTNTEWNWSWTNWALIYQHLRK